MVACDPTSIPIAEHADRTRIHTRTRKLRLAVHYHRIIHGSRALSHTILDFQNPLRGRSRPATFGLLHGFHSPLFCYRSTMMACVECCNRQAIYRSGFLFGVSRQIKWLRSTGYPGRCLIFQMSSRTVPCSSGISFGGWLINQWKGFTLVF